jgi:signal transduction histidine kinase
MRSRLRTGFLAALVLALLSLVISILVPRFLARGYDRKSLAGLKAKSGRIKQEFASVLKRHALILETTREFPASVSGDARGMNALLHGLGLEPDTEGAACYDKGGKLLVWLGNVVDIEDHVPAGTLSAVDENQAPFLIRDKASIYLISVVRLQGGGHLALAKLLAFIPRVESSYVGETHFLGHGLMKRCDIDYWSFREDVEGFERIFSRSGDEFAGQPRRENEIQTLYFPLRGPDRRILATVTLSSPSLTERLTAVRENILIFFYGFLVAALVCLLLGILLSPGLNRDRRGTAFLAAIFVLLSIRILLFPLCRLGPVHSLSIFSPSGAGFVSIGPLTRSPADIFLTAFAAALLAAFAAVYARPLFSSPKKAFSGPASAIIAAGALLTALGLLAGFKETVGRLVSNSNISLLRFEPGAVFWLLHLSLLMLFAAALASAYLILRATVVRSTGPAVFFSALVPSLAVLIIVWRGRYSLFAAGLPAALLILGIILARAPEKARRREFFGLGILIAGLFLVQTVEQASDARTRNLIQYFLRNSVLSQDQWGNFFMRESLPEIEKRGAAIASFLKEPGSPDFARTIWEKTLAARTNWYSSLELQDPEGNTLSRFSLNVPKLYGRGLSLPLNREWTVTRATVSSMGRERDFLVGHKDWYEGEVCLGRALLYLSLDPEMLPFLYSANPYFELLRAGPIPSLNNVDFGLLLFDGDGRFLFNPHKISSGIPADALNKLRTSDVPFWGDFKDGSRGYSAFYFRKGNRFYSLFTPRKSLRARAVGFLKFLFLDLFLAFLLAVPAVLRARKKPARRVFWSFSNKVYASFFAVALVPLLFFTLFTRGLFDRIFSDRFIEEAAARATFAKSILEDFLYFQDGGRTLPQPPPEDLVLWVSATLSNDVSLYRDAKLVSSSRREFFDSGLLPDLIDGDIAFRLLHDRAPFSTQRKKIGGYSFQTLTVPYDLGGSVFLISMPFPFEKQEAARATGELVEFILLLSAFFAGLVVLFARGVRAMIVVPVRKLLAGTREVGLGNLEVEIEHASRDEMRTLVDGFNSMVGNLKAQRMELAEMGKKVAWTEMARKVAHEIKNPLTPIQLSAEHILKVYEDGGDLGKTLRESVSYIIGEVENLRHISQDFMEIARDSTLQKEACDLRHVLEDVLAPYKKLLSARIRFREAYEGTDFLCPADPWKIRTAFRNIVANAVEAVKDKGEIVLRVRREADGLAIIIGDTGPGMPPEVLEKIFEPYFSTKDAGTGLGLPIARKIIEDHGGTVTAASRPGQGTEIVVRLPCGR